jgi:hypothetical protein
MSLIQNIKERVKGELDHRKQVGEAYRESRHEADIKYAKERAIRDSQERYMPRPGVRTRSEDRLSKMDRILGGGGSSGVKDYSAILSGGSRSESKNINKILSGGSSRGGGMNLSGLGIPGMGGGGHRSVGGSSKKKSSRRRIIIEG